MRLEITDEDGKKQIFETKKSEIIVGRSYAADARVGSENLGRSHISIIEKEGNLFVTDLGSANGTTINGELLTPKKEIKWYTSFPIVLSQVITVAFLEDIVEIELEDNSHEKQKRKKSSLAVQVNKPDSPGNSSTPKRKAHKHTAKILAFITIIVLGYFFMTQDSDKNLIASDISANNPSTDAVKMKAKPIFPVAAFEEFFNKNKCISELEARFCTQAGYKFSGNDGFILNKDDLYYFLDFDQQFRNGSFSVNLSKVDKKDYQRLLMSKEAFRDFFLSSLEDNGIENLYLINYVSKPYSRITQILKVTKTNMRKISTQDAAAIIERLQNGDQTVYQALMAPLLEWSE